MSSHFSFPMCIMRHHERVTLQADRGPNQNRAMHGLGIICSYSLDEYLGLAWGVPHLLPMNR